MKMLPVILKATTTFLLLAALTLVASCGLGAHPSDQALEQRLRSDEADFNRLVAMLKEDSDIVRLGEDFVFLSEDSNRLIPKERLDEYRRLFRKLGLEAGFHRSGSKLRLIASSKGMIIPNSEKSYVFSADELSPLVDSLERVIRDNRGDQPPVFKRLYGNWYIYYESW